MRQANGKFKYNCTSIDLYYRSAIASVNEVADSGVKPVDGQIVEIPLSDFIPLRTILFELQMMKILKRW